MKKKMLLFVAGLLSVSLAWAQPAQVQINIHVSTNSSAIQGALHGYKVLLWDRTASGGSGRPLYTDINGDLNLLYTSFYTTGSGSFSYEVRDCQNQLVSTKTVNYSTQGAQVALSDSAFVACVDPCNVFGSVNNNGNRYHFTAHAGANQLWDMENAQWDFSDGTTYTGRWITKPLPLGTHTWKLTHQGCVADSGSVNVIGTCHAHFSIDTATSGNGIVNMFNNSTATSSGNTLYYFWQFGDGTTSNLPFPQHQYSGNGPYSVYLNMIEVDLMGDTICQSFHGDTLGIDSAGNVFKTGFTINVMDPNSFDLSNNTVLEFNLFPQPASKVIRIETSTKLNYVELIDLNGRVVQEWMPENGKYLELLLKKHPSGMYLIRAYGDHGVSNHKCLIE